MRMGDRWNRIAVILGAVAVLLAASALVSSRQEMNRLASRADDLSRRVEQLSDTQVQLDPAVPSAKPISRPATDVPAPIRRDHPEVIRVELTTVELDGVLADGTTYRYWTFDGTVPGPMIRVREGDIVELTLKNPPESSQAHNIDLHAVNGPGGGAQVTWVTPGTEKTFRFMALNPGLYIYHCAAPHIPTHIAMGMYGLILVEPRQGLPAVDREFYLVQGEVYANAPPGTEGHAVFSGEGLLNEHPHYVVFNGRFHSFTGERALRAAVGERVRLFVGNAGPNLASSFHLIGEIFDVVHPEGASEAVHNVQGTLIPAGGATWVEFTLDVPGEYVFIDHSISRAIDKGALGVIRVEGPENPEIFQAVQPGESRQDEKESGYRY